MRALTSDTPKNVYVLSCQYLGLSIATYQAPLRITITPIHDKYRFRGPAIYRIINYSSDCLASRNIISERASTVVMYRIVRVLFYRESVWLLQSVTQGCKQ